MYHRESLDQVVMEEFRLPFHGKLEPENRWVKLAQIMPWDKIEEYYLKTMSQKTGRNAFSARIAFGAIYVRQSEKLSDEAVVTFIQENPKVDSDIKETTIQSLKGSMTEGDYGLFATLSHYTKEGTGI